MRAGHGDPPAGQTDAPAPILIKICGITRPEDAACAAACGADWLGLNFWPLSRRALAPGIAAAIARARDIAEAARAAGPVASPVRVAAVFVNQPADDIVRVAAESWIDAVQLHGDETPAQCEAISARLPERVAIIKAVALRTPEAAARISKYPGALVVVDAPSGCYGGAGVVADWSLARAAVSAARTCGKRLILAGGLTPDNVADAIAVVGPAGVDVASGVESATGDPRIKDPARIARFVAIARQAARNAARSESGEPADDACAAVEIPEAADRTDTTEES